MPRQKNPSIILHHNPLSPTHVQNFGVSVLLPILADDSFEEAAVQYNLGLKETLGTEKGALSRLLFRPGCAGLRFLSPVESPDIRTNHVQRRYQNQRQRSSEENTIPQSQSHRLHVEVGSPKAVGQGQQTGNRKPQAGQSIVVYLSLH